MNHKILISFSLVVVLLVIGYWLLAIQSASADGASLDCKESNNAAYPWCAVGQSGPAPLVSRFYVIALGFAAASAMGVLIYGGILWTMSGAVTSKKDAMDWIWGAIWGFVLIIAAYLILYTINPSLVNLTNPPLPQSDYWYY